MHDGGEVLVRLKDHIELHKICTESEQESFSGVNTIGCSNVFEWVNGLHTQQFCHLCFA